MARSNMPRSIVCAIARKNDSQGTSARKERRAGWATQDASSGIACNATIIDHIVEDTTTMVTTIATVAIMTAVDANLDERSAIATIKKKQSRGNRRAQEAPRGQQSSSDNVKENVGALQRASTRQKEWLQRPRAAPT
jgi:hypothetical protein